MATSPPPAELVGPARQIYALDIDPAALQAVRQITERHEASNVKVILSDCSTGLPDDSVDVVLLYDTFHGLARPADVLRELHRVLKTDGVLSFHDHHMKEQDIMASLTGTGMFTLAKRGQRTYTFVKITAAAR